MTPNIPDWLEVEPEIHDALARGEPVVALESTVLTHGLPRPINLELARRMEIEVRKAGAIPATAAVLHGQLRLGLKAEELDWLAVQDQARKISLRDLGAARSQAASGGTTVAATMFLARAAGIRVFATGGIGGVHRGQAGDISADLPALASLPVGVVCSGAKAILDLPRTLEWLETAGVPVIGLGTDEFPAFYSQTSGLPVSARVEDVQGAARLLRQHWDLDLPGGALVCVPCPAQTAVEAQVIQRALEVAEREAAEVRGAQLTPFLLARLVELTEGQALRANLALLQQNARVAGAIAVALA